MGFERVGPGKFRGPPANRLGGLRVNKFNMNQTVRLVSSRTTSLGQSA
jgi:hypothetical protein